jgi:hypothetical protein
LLKSKLQSAFSGLILSNILLMSLLAFAPLQASALTSPPATAVPANTAASSSPGGTYQAPPVVYQGVQASIQRLLCTPGISSNSAPDTSGALDGPVISSDPTVTNPDSRDLAVCVNRLYRFGGAIGAFAGVFFIGLSGYFYLLGGEHAKEKAKGMIFSVIAGLLIIFTAFILLKAINPDAVKFKSIQPPTLSGVPDEFLQCKALGLPEGCVVSADSFTETSDSSGSNVYAACQGGLVDVPNTIANGAVGKMCSELLNKLIAAQQAYKQSLPGYTFLIGATTENPAAHVSKCHKLGFPQTGNCADISPRNGTGTKPAASDKGWEVLCKVIQSAGIKVGNEAGPNIAGCPAFELGPITNPNPSNAHFHVFLSA